MEKNVLKKNIRIAKSKFSTFNTSEVIVLVLITTIISLTMGYILPKGNVSTSSEKSNEYKEVGTALENFLEEYKYIVDNYYGDVNEEELLNSALASILSSLGDPYSGMMNGSASNTMMTRLNGYYSGLGVEVMNNEENNIYILNVFKDSPAFKAGLKVGDKVLSMNGTSALNKSTTDFVAEVAEQGDKEITLIVSRDSKEITVTLKRGNIVLKSVESKFYEKNDRKTGYILITIFASNTGEQFKKELAALEKKGIDSLIIDVRDNSGGHLTAVDDMISQFLNKKHVIYQIQDKENVEKIYSSGTKTKNYDVSVLVNKNSASASEMLAAALQEEYKATIIGIQTFGKGTVQEVNNNSNGDVQYKLTTKKWLTPKGVWINGKGVTPNVIVDLNEAYAKNPVEENDNQLQKAFDLLKK